MPLELETPGLPPEIDRAGDDCMTGSCLLHVSGILSLTNGPGIPRPASLFNMSNCRVVGRYHRSHRLLEITTHDMRDSFLVNAQKTRLYDYSFCVPSYSSRARPSLTLRDTFNMESTFCTHPLSMSGVSITFAPFREIPLLMLPSLCLKCAILFCSFLDGLGAGLGDNGIKTLRIGAATMFSSNVNQWKTTLHCK